MAESDRAIGQSQATGDRGIPPLCVRKDTGGDVAGADGKYAPPQLDANGNLRVNVAAGSSSGTEYTDGDAVATPDGGVSLGHDGSNVRALKTDADGHLQIDVLTGGGGGTQYTEGDTDATITGTAMMMEGAGNALVPAQGTVADGQLVNLGANNDVTVTSGSITANAGTNLNTSALALESGGNLDTIAGDTTSIDGKITACNTGAVTISSALPAGTNLVGDVSLQPRSDSNGLSVANFTSGDTYTALTNSAQVIKASAGKFYGYYIYNPNSSATYVMIYDIAAASVTVGTSTAKLVFCIPATSAANLEISMGIPFTNAGWSIAAATTGGGNSAPSTALEAMVWYK